MAAKHDAKKARANMWVTHQNLAAAKGGRPHYQFKERKVALQVRPVPPPKPVDTCLDGVPAALTPTGDPSGAPTVAVNPRASLWRRCPLLWRTRQCTADRTFPPDSRRPLAPAFAHWERRT